MTELVHWVFPCPELPAPIFIEAGTKFLLIRDLLIDGKVAYTLEFESLAVEDHVTVRSGDLLTACGLIPLRTLNRAEGAPTCLACVEKDLSLWPMAYTARFAL